MYFWNFFKIHKLLSSSILTRDLLLLIPPTPSLCQAPDPNHLFIQEKAQVSRWYSCTGTSSWKATSSTFIQFPSISLWSFIRLDEVQVYKNLTILPANLATWQNCCKMYSAKVFIDGNIFSESHEKHDQPVYCSKNWIKRTGHWHVYVVANHDRL